MPKLLPANFPWALSIFPLLELGFFMSSVMLLDYALPLALGLLAGAAVFLSFSIHIFFHECVHLNKRYTPLFSWPASVWIGLPFDGYRIHHYNHHRYENGVLDFSCTWIDRERGIPYSALSYTFGWPRQLLASVRCKTPFGGNSRSADHIKQAIPAQKKVLLLTLIGMALLGWKVLVCYLALIYCGWALTSLHNFGQHPPLPGQAVSTFSSALYNKLFFNNGLHWEHHYRPALAWNALALNTHSPRIRHAHIISPLLRLETTDERR